MLLFCIKLSESSEMIFSDVFNQSASLCHFSPDGAMLANAVQYRLIVRDTKTLQVSLLSGVFKCSTFFVNLLFLLSCNYLNSILNV